MRIKVCRLALLENCKRSLEITVPVEELEAEAARVITNVQKRARLPGFRPGKAPASLIRTRFEEDIRHKVLENLIPKHFREHIEREDLRVVGRPDFSEVHFKAGEPLRFKAEFEVAPDIELKEYRGLSVPYEDPEITDEQVAQRLEELRDQKADYVNVDPRPLQDGDFAVVALQSIVGIEGQPVKQDELMLHIGSADTLESFTENLRGLSPGEERQFDVTYPEDYLPNRLAGKTVRFLARIKGIRRKELPELNDDFAQDLGDYRTVGELRESVRRSLFAQRQFEAQQEAKNKLIDALIDIHDFPVPEAYIDQQVRNRVEQNLRLLAAEGVDPKSVQVDWHKAKTAQHDKAVREVKASLLLSRIAEREAIEPMRDEVDREVERIAKQKREPFAAVRVRFEKDGTLGRIASNIQTEKTLNFLFEHARKVAQ